MKAQTIIKPFLACLIFLLSMLVTSVLLLLLFRGIGITNVPIMISLSSVFSGILTVFILSALSMIRWREAFGFSRLRLGQALGILFFSLFVIVGLNMISELMDLVDNNAEQTLMLVHTPLGVAVLAVFAPLVEELVFREAMLGWMLRHGGKPLAAILLSSFAFGAIHANPAQIPFAIVMGCLLGYLYYKTDSVVLSMLLHILNNTLAVVLLLHYGEHPSWIEIGDFAIVLVGAVLIVLGALGVHRLSASVSH